LTTPAARGRAWPLNSIPSGAGNKKGGKFAPGFCFKDKAQMRTEVLGQKNQRGRRN
jgi:hypothetical protein